MVLRKLINGQVRLSRRVDRRLPDGWRRDGNQQYLEQLVPAHLRPDLRIYDVGGGKRPYLAPEQNDRLRAHVVGIDIDPIELGQAPLGSYDRMITADIAKFRGEHDADLIVCKAVFEHVADVDGATEALATILKPGGTGLIFVPCRNAVFARINLLLPERIKRAVLFALYPRTSQHQGFPSHYQNRTPSALTRLARARGLETVDLQTYWTSAYFEAFFPAYLIWRTWTVAARALGWTDCCETFTLTLRKPEAASAPAD